MNVITKNIENSAVKISVEKAVPEEIIIDTDINLENVGSVEIRVLNKENNSVAAQGGTMTTSRHTITKKYTPDDEKPTFNPGEKYRVCVGVIDKNNNLIYRWQEYVTIK